MEPLHIALQDGQRKVIGHCTITRDGQAAALDGRPVLTAIMEVTDAAGAAVATVCFGVGGTEITFSDGTLQRVLSPFDQSEILFFDEGFAENRVALPFAYMLVQNGVHKERALQEMMAASLPALRHRRLAASVETAGS